MIAYLIYSAIIFSLLFVAIRATANAVHQKRKNKMQNTPATINEPSLDELIAATNGKFFSITFTKKDGSVRVVNGKDKYNRLIVGTGLRPQGIVPFVDRNKKSILDKRGGGWVSTKNDSVITFKCGSVVKEFHA